MHLTPEQKTIFFPFAGMGGAVKGFQNAGWSVDRASAVEILDDRCQTLRANFPKMWVTKADISDCVLAEYGPHCKEQVLVAFITCPCQKYTYGADISQTRQGDHLYLEALRDCIFLAPEVIVFENVMGILAPKFKRLQETLKRLRGYYTTQFIVNGYDFSLMRKQRVIMVLHRQPFIFQDIRAYRTVRPMRRLRDYLDERLDPFAATIHPYIAKRIAGGYRDLPVILDPDMAEPIPFLYNYGHDRGAYLVKDKRVPGGLRPFSVAEFARLSTFDPETFKICGPVTKQYQQVADCVYPGVAEAIGRALNAYFEAIPSLYEPEQPLGYREVVSLDVQPMPTHRPVEPIKAEPQELWV